MKKIFKFLFNRWTFAILGLVAIGLLIWFVGPLIALADYRPLESSTIRIILITLIVGIYVGKLIWQFIKARNLNTQLVEGLLRQTTQQPSSSNEAGAEEVALLRKRFEEAVAVLKQSDPRGNTKRPFLSSLMHRQYLYELPWYIFIGAPGSGKTTALINSGLQFPLAERFGQEVVHGIGGTRNCDWWFTDDAVLLDTAGRYTTQESDKETDSAAWTGFLQLLKKYRPRRPINGIIVTVSVSDLLEQTPAQIEAQANALRKRIQELHTELNIRFPLYVLVTKTDLLAGFTEFFDKFGKEERTQVWGTSFPLSEDQETSSLISFDSEFSALEKRLNDRLLDYLQQERNLQKREVLYTFPQQFSSLKAVLGTFLNQVFLPSRFEQQPLLRGIYFTSGTQEGNPIDRVMGNLGRALQLDHKLLAPNRPVGKSFFLTKLIKNVIFPESELAGTNLRWERQQRTLQWSGFIVATLLTISLVAAWTVSYLNNKSYVAKVETEIAAVSKQVDDIPAIQHLNIISLLPTLKSVLEFTKISTIDSDSVPLSMSLGLYQGDKLAAASNNAYQRLLQETYLPQLVFRIEQLLNNAGQHHTELLYEGLKAYLMLHDSRHIDPIALKAFIITDWETSLPREVTIDQREELEFHLDNLLSQGQLSSPIPINTQLVENVRSIVSRTPISQRIYTRLKLQGVGSSIAEFTLTRVVGPTAALVFTRTSQRPLTQGVPGLFSYDGYYKVFTKASKKIAKQLADEEIWVLDLKEKNPNRFLDPQVETELIEEIRRLYLLDYAQTWETFINDIKLVHTSTLQESIQSARLLSAADSPLPILLNAIVKEVTLVNTGEADKNVIDKATEGVRSARDQLKLLLGQTDDREPTASIISRPEHIVDDRFKDLRRMVHSTIPGQPAPIDTVITQINDLYMLLTATDTALKSGSTPPPSDVPTRIKADAGYLPEPVRSMLTTLSTSGISQALGQKRVMMNQALKANVTDFCLKATSERYPFTKTSIRDVTQDDFARLFAPGGIFDNFFQNNLAAYVDTSAYPWRFQKSGDASMGLASTDLQAFHQAKIIRDTFFRHGGNSPAMEFVFKPIDMDPSITQFILDIDGQLVKYSHGPQVPISVRWPGPRGSSQVRLQISPITSYGASGQVFEGPWALFRMFDKIEIKTSVQPERFFTTFNVDGREIQFEVVTSSVQNPFRLRALEQFSCPKRL